MAGPEHRNEEIIRRMTRTGGDTQWLTGNQVSRGKKNRKGKAN